MGFFNPFAGLGSGKGENKSKDAEVYLPFGTVENCQEYIIGTPYKFYNRPTLVLNSTDVRGADKRYIQFAELNFYDAEGNVINFNDYNPTITGSKVELATGESVDKVIDRDPNTKYFTDLDSNVGLTITLESDYTGMLKYFSYVTGSDAPERDAITFTIDLLYKTSMERILIVNNAEIPVERKAETQLFELSYGGIN